MRRAAPLAAAQGPPARSGRWPLWPARRVGLEEGGLDGPGGGGPGRWPLGCRRKGAAALWSALTRRSRLASGHAGTLATQLRNATRRLQEAQVRPRKRRAAQRASGSPATGAAARRAAPRLRKLDGTGGAAEAGGAAAAAGAEEPITEPLS